MTLQHCIKTLAFLYIKIKENLFTIRFRANPIYKTRPLNTFSHLKNSNYYFLCCIYFRLKLTFPLLKEKKKTRQNSDTPQHRIILIKLQSPISTMHEHRTYATIFLAFPRVTYLLNIDYIFSFHYKLIRNLF